jgi:hypothetical protein
MICPPCRNQVHRACPELRRQQDTTLSETDRAGGQWCDCLHVLPGPFTAPVADLGQRVDLGTGRGHMDLAR